MSLALLPQRVRLSVDPLDHNGLVCRLQSTAPKIWRGTEAYIEVGLYYDGVFVDDESGITSLHLDILSYADRDGTPLVQKSSAVANLSSESDWTGNSSSKYHGRFSLTKTDTQFSMTDAVENVLTLWVVVHALMVSGDYITLGAGQLQVEEDGAQNNLTAPGGAVPAFRISDGELQLWNPDQSKWHTIYVKGAAGAEYLAIGPAEA